MLRKERIERKTLNLIYFSIVGRILLIIKDMLVARQIGVCCEMDNYVLALSTLSFPTIVVADAILISLIPLLQIIKKNEGEARRIDYTNNIINITFLASIVFMGLGFLFAPRIIGIFGPGLIDFNLKEATSLFRIGLPIVLVSWLKAIAGGYLQSNHAFKAGAKGLVSNPLVFILYLLLFSTMLIARGLMLKGLMVAGIIAILSQVYISYQAMKNSGFKYKWKIDLGDKYLKKMLNFLIPIGAGFGINEINKSIDNAMASILPSGSIAELNYANNIISLFLGVFVAAIVTVIFPVLSESHNEDEREELKEGIKYGVRMILSFAVPLSLVLMIFSQPIVRLIFQRGAFDAEATLYTAQALSYLAIGFIALTFIPVITRAYYSIQEMKIPFYIGFLSFGINLFLNIILIRSMGIAGIALATSVSSMIFVALGFYGLNKRLRF